MAGEAEALALRVVETRPEHPDPLHILGVATAQGGHPDAAVGLFERAIAAGGPNPAYLLNLGAALQAAGRAEDASGPAVARALTERLGARVSWTGIVPDEQDTIADTLRDIAERGFDLAVTTGGTGCGPRDVTPEATRAVITREVPGLAEAMRTESAKTTPHALLQRGLCGIAGGTLIINLPGSPRAAVENLTVILPTLPHAVNLLRGQTDH